MRAVNERFDNVLQQISVLQQQQMEDRDSLKNFIQQHSLSKGYYKLGNGTLSHQLARGVSSVVGLKEAITWRSKFLKCVWTFSLCVGVAGTAFFVCATWKEYISHPTATRIEIVSQPHYHYPPTYLCPNIWLDATKALSLGLSMEGLKYSLGYVNLYRDKIGPENPDIGREEFFSFFDKSNYTSFDDYWIQISVDVPLEPSFEKYQNTFYTSAYCSRCNGSFLPKIVTSFGVCYNFEMQPENGRGLLSTITRQIGMQLRNRSLGLTTSMLWFLYIGIGRLHVSLKNPIMPSVAVKEFTYTTVRFREVQVHMEPKFETPCLLDNDVMANYSATACITKCLKPHFSRALNCTPFSNTVGKFENHPSELCNSFNNVTGYKFQETMESRKDLVLASDEAKLCYRKCPYRCRRKRFETSYDGEFNGMDHSVEFADAVRIGRLNATPFVDIYIQNAAMYEGGIMTIREVNTISFIELISNVGGSLGLFVGCTMMTFVQIALVIVNFFAEKRKVVKKVDIVDIESKV